MKLALPLSLAAMLAGCAEPAPLVTVTDARVIALPASAAAYFTLTNSGGPDRLLSVAAPGTGDATIHETVMDGDMMRMQPVTGGVAVPAGATVRFSPQGRHVMIMPSRPIADPLVRLVLTFERQGAVTVSAPAKGPTA